MKNVDRAEQKHYWESRHLLARRHPEHPVIREYVLPKIQLIKRYVEFRQDTRLLDVGCGNGFFTFYFDQICDATGVDFSEKMLALNPVSKKQQMDAAALRFDDNTFDIVFCHALLHHVEDIDRVLSEMRRVSKKNVVVLEPNILNPLMFLFSALKKEERGALKFSLPYLRSKIEQNGLAVVTSFSYGMIVPNKTPAFLLPVMRLFNFSQPLGMTNIILAEK